MNDFKNSLKQSEFVSLSDPLTSRDTRVVLECVELCKDYVDADILLKILTGVSLTVTAGEQIAIMGRSGSGKTTLLQMLGGLDAPTRGKVLINGQDIHALSEPNRCRLRNQAIGYVYQFHHLLPEFTALENVAMPLLIANTSKNKASSRAAELLDAVGLKDRLHHKPGELSGGERQRVAVARALANEPECLLADEPTGNLDDENAQHVFEVMRGLNRVFKTSVILVTHDPNLAAQMDRTLVLQNGILQEMDV